MKQELKYRLTRMMVVGLSLIIYNFSFSPARAQVTGTSSSYSRFGLGLLSDQSQGFNKSMAGVGLGVRIGNRVNTTNPASYSAIDSLSFILDVGMSASFGKMTQDTQTKGVKNASLDYVHAGMRIAKKLGLAVGFMPYTSIGYEFSTPEITTGQNPQNTLINSRVDTYYGNGGLNQAYLGLGWRALGNLSVGVNASFVWGKYGHTVMPSFKEGGVVSDDYNTTLKNYSAYLKTYKLDFGAQYPVRLTKQDWLNVGATFGLGHKIAQDLELTTGLSVDTIPSPFDLPYSFGIGAAWQHKNTLLVAADVHEVFWSNCRLPLETPNGYAPMKGGYKNMTKIAVGAQWTPAPFDKSFWKRIQYRAGINYTTPYLVVNGQNGPTELRMCAGVGLPIMRTNNRSTVNVGVEWLRRSSSAVGMVKENYFLINIGMTFNDLWFMKYKIE